MEARLDLDNFSPGASSSAGFAVVNGWSNEAARIRNVSPGAMENRCRDEYRDTRVVVSDKAPSANARICFPPQVTVGF